MKKIRIGSHFVTFTKTGYDVSETSKKMDWWNNQAQKKEGLYRLALEFFETEEPLFDLETEVNIFYVPDYDNYYAVKSSGEDVLDVKHFYINEVVKMAKIDDVSESHILLQ